MPPKQRIDPIKTIGVDNDTLVINSIEYFHSNSEDFVIHSSVFFLLLFFSLCAWTMSDQKLVEWIHYIYYMEKRLKCGVMYAVDIWPFGNIFIYWLWMRQWQERRCVSVSHRLLFSLCEWFHSFWENFVFSRPVTHGGNGLISIRE